MFDLENLGQIHQAKHSRLYHSVVITNLYKSHIAPTFMLAFTVSEILRFEMFNLENLSQGHRDNICKVYKSHSWEFFASSQRLPYISISNFVNVGQGHKYNICNGAILLQTHEFLFDGNRKKFYDFDLENEVQGQGEEIWDLFYLTGNVHIHISSLFQNFSYLGIYVYLCKLGTHKHTHTHTARQGWWL